MKLLTNLLVLSLLVVALASCTKATVPEEANVTFVFDHVVDDKALEQNTPLDYTNASGNKYSASTLKYIVSNIVLIDQSDNEIAFNNYDIIDAFGNNKLDAQKLPNGTYKKMRITLGVNAGQNLSSNPAGDLSPGNDMYFSSSEGYIFLKHEGRFLNSSNDIIDLRYNYGKTGNEVQFEMPVGGLTVNGVDKTAYITFNLNELYKNAPVDFNAGATRNSTPEDAPWIAAIKANIPNSFSFSGSYEVK